jgi:hypothetical protein
VKPAPIKLDLGAPSGQQEHITGFKTEADALDWIANDSAAWLESAQSGNRRSARCTASGIVSVGPLPALLNRRRHDLEIVSADAGPRPRTILYCVIAMAEMEPPNDPIHW